jgi:hypothetical protein
VLVTEDDGRAADALFDFNLDGGLFHVRVWVCGCVGVGCGCGYFSAGGQHQTLVLFYPSHCNW